MLRTGWFRYGVSDGVLSKQALEEEERIRKEEEKRLAAEAEAKRLAQEAVVKRLAEQAAPSHQLRRTPASLGDTQHRLHRQCAR